MVCPPPIKLIVSLEKRINELNETLQEAGDSYMEKLAEVQNLQKRLSYQVCEHSSPWTPIHLQLCSPVHPLLPFYQQERETEHLQRELTERELELQGMKEDLAKLTHDSVGQSRQKRGLLVNIKESMSSPSSGNLCRTIRKSVRTTASLRKKPNWSSVLYAWLSRCLFFIVMFVFI